MEQNTNQETIIELSPNKPLGAFHHTYIFFLFACAYFNTNLTITYFGFFPASDLENSYKAKVSFFVCLLISVVFIFLALFNLLLLVKKRRFFITFNAMFLVSGSVKIAFIDGFLYNYGIYHSYIGKASNLEENYLEDKGLGALIIFVITLTAGLLIIGYYKKRRQHFPGESLNETTDRITAVSTKRKTVILPLWTILTLYLITTAIIATGELKSTKEELESLQSKVNQLTKENQTLKTALSNTADEIAKLHDYTDIDDSVFLRHHKEFMDSLLNYIEPFYTGVQLYE